MNAEDLDYARENILRLCRAANRVGLTAVQITRGLQRAAFAVDERETDAQIQHLEKAGLIAEIEGAALTPALRRYTTTVEGDRELEKRGLL